MVHILARTKHHTATSKQTFTIFGFENFSKVVPVNSSKRNRLLCTRSWNTCANQQAK